MNLPDTSRLTFDPKKHAYLLDGTKHLTGVTTVLSGTSDKAQLINWSANMAVDYIKENAKWNDFVEEEGAYLATPLLMEQARTAHTKKKEAAGSKGTDTHALVEEWINNCIKFNQGRPLPQAPKETIEFMGVPAEKVCTKSEIIKPFADWALTEVDHFLASEQRLFDEENAIGGTADFFYVSLKGELVAADLKSFPVMWSPDAYCQTGIYARMWRLLTGDQATKSVVVKMCDPTDPRLKKYDADAFAVYPRYALQEDEDMFLKRLDVYRYNQNYTKPSK